jgi:hypothetical protein
MYERERLRLCMNPFDSVHCLMQRNTWSRRWALSYCWIRCLTETVLRQRPWVWTLVFMRLRQLKLVPRVSGHWSNRQCVRLYLHITNHFHACSWCWYYTRGTNTHQHIYLNLPATTLTWSTHTMTISPMNLSFDVDMHQMFICSFLTIGCNKRSTCTYMLINRAPDCFAAVFV